jgi:hypothetical protein
MLHLLLCFGCGCGMLHLCTLEVDMSLKTTTSSLMCGIPTAWSGEHYGAPWCTSLIASFQRCWMDLIVPTSSCNQFSPCTVKSKLGTECYYGTYCISFKLKYFTYCLELSSSAHIPDVFLLKVYDGLSLDAPPPLHSLVHGLISSCLRYLYSVAIFIVTILKMGTHTSSQSRWVYTNLYMFGSPKTRRKNPTHIRDELCFLYGVC